MKKKGKLLPLLLVRNSKSNWFCSYDTPEHKTSLRIYTIKRLEPFDWLMEMEVLIVNVTMSEQKILYSNGAFVNL